MPRPAKGAHLYLRRRAGREPQWTIRDGANEIGTGCAERDNKGAEKRLAAYLAEKYRPDFGDGDPRHVSIADILTLYAKERVPLTKRPQLAAWTMAPIEIWWGDKIVAEVTAGRCRDYVAWRTSQPLANFKTAPARTVTASTARRELGLLQAALNYAHGEGKLRYPVPVTLPPQGAARMRWLTRDEAARLLWAAWRQGNRHVARFVLLGLYTGTRHDAILSLGWLPNTVGGWIDLDDALLYRRGTAEADSKKRRTPIPVSDRLAAHCRRWRRDDGAFVVTWHGLRLAKMRRAWHSARIVAGLGPEVTPHVLRHTFASWAVQDGHSFAKVAAALGTTEKVVEQTYGHLAPGHLRDVVASVSRKG
jgi:integrase